jgi:ribonuclease Z
LHIYGPIHTAIVVDGLRVIAPVLPFEVEVHELKSGDRIELPGGMTGRVIAGDHRVPSLIYRIEVARGRGFDREAAEAFGVPVTLWSKLQRGESVVVNGEVVAADDVLGPERPGLAFGFMTDTRPVPAAPTFLAGVDLLVSEGTYGDNAQHDKAVSHKHMTFAEAAAVARDAGAKALWLTHLSHAMERPEEFLPNATAIFPETTVGYTGLATTLSFED